MVELSDIPLVEFICYCLNPNHYHFIIKQLQDDGIVKFMHKLGTSYTNYINLKHKRSGSLFQGKFKASLIKDITQLLHLSGYVNGNSEIHGIANDASKYTWSSCSDYLQLRNGTLCNKSTILSEFDSIDKYRDFVKGTIKDVKQLKKENAVWLE